MMQRVWEGVEFDVERQGLADRVVGVLAEAALGLKVWDATYRALVRISENLASRDLKGLADAGWLIAVGERRGRVYVAGDDLRRTGDITASGESLTESDPFAWPFEFAVQRKGVGSLSSDVDEKGDQTPFRPPESMQSRLVALNSRWHNQSRIGCSSATTTCRSVRGGLPSKHGPPERPTPRRPVSSRRCRIVRPARFRCRSGPSGFDTRPS